MPSLVPPAAGKWWAHDDTLTFVPADGFQPWTIERVEVPAALATPESARFNVKGPNMLRVQQLLAELQYIPFNFGPTAGQDNLVNEPFTAAAVPSAAQPGKFTWAYSDVPASLAALWSAGQGNVITTGAVMQFEAQQNMDTDGVVGPAVWKALTAAVATRHFDPNPYDYLMVSENVPEGLVVWRNGQDLYKTPVNTGVPGATTQTGTFPVYARYETTTMAGTDVDGTKYDVPGVPWVAYFNGGDAVHGYWRYSYGYPQSNGCVELPIANAEVVWSMDPLGTLVTVSA
jgi:lipoprotein-anchoring transpeptidase ErfK/SrfK